MHIMKVIFIVINFKDFIYCFSLYETITYIYIFNINAIYMWIKMGSSYGKDKNIYIYKIKSNKTLLSFRIELNNLLHIFF